MAEPQNPLIDLISQTFTNTSGVARRLNAMRLNRGILWSMLVLVSILSVFALQISLLVYPEASRDPFGSIRPFTLTIIVGSALTLTVFALYFAGQALGGTGRFPGALLLTIWWQVIAIVLQGVQTIALLITPALAGIVTMICLGFSIFCLVVFVDEMHGFHSRAKATAAVIVAFVGILFGLSIILTLIGVAAQGGAA